MNFVRSLAVFAAAAAALLSSPAAAKLSPVEQAMVRTVDSEQERTVAMLGKWVEQNSGTMNFAGVRAVGEMLRGELEPLGFSTRWADESGADRAGHLVAYHPSAVSGRRGKKILLIGHLDTVFEKDSPFQHWEIDGDTGIGPGSNDDKGGMAVIVAALRAMKAAGTLRNADITVVLSGDEEDAGDPVTISRAALVREGKRADVAIDFEPLAVRDGRDMGSTARRSSGSWTVTASGRSAHSAGIFGDVGYGAIYELARILDEFRRQLPEENLTYNVGLVTGGATAELQDDTLKGVATGKTNIIPGTAIARGDIRALSQEQIDRTKAKMQAIVARSLPGTVAILSFDPGDYPPMAPTAGNRAILTELNAVNRDMGIPEMGELPPSDRGAGDISFVAADVDSLAGMGASGSGSHAPGETVDIPSIAKQAKRTAILLTRLSRQRP